MINWSRKMKTRTETEKRKGVACRFRICRDRVIMTVRI
jgi:hypothetical protein